jgi:hypothetical protein
MDLSYERYVAVEVVVVVTTAVSAVETILLYSLKNNQPIQNHLACSLFQLTQKFITVITQKYNRTTSRDSAIQMIQVLWGVTLRHW